MPEQTDGLLPQSFVLVFELLHLVEQVPAAVQLLGVEPPNVGRPLLVGLVVHRLHKLVLAGVA